MGASESTPPRPVKATNTSWVTELFGEPARSLLVTIRQCQDSQALRTAFDAAAHEITVSGVTTVTTPVLQCAAAERVVDLGALHSQSWTIPVQQAFMALLKANDRAMKAVTVQGPWSRQSEHGPLCLGTAPCDVQEIKTTLTKDMALEVSGFGAVWLPQLFDYDVSTPGSRFTFSVTAYVGGARKDEVIIAMSATKVLWGKGECDALTFKTTPNGSTCLRTGMYKEFEIGSSLECEFFGCETFIIELSYSNITVSGRTAAAPAYVKKYINHPWPASAPRAGSIGLLGQADQTVCYYGCQILRRAGPQSASSVVQTAPVPVAPVDSSIAWRQQGNDIMLASRKVVVNALAEPPAVSAGALVLKSNSAVWLPHLSYDVTQPGSRLQFSVDATPTAATAQLLVAFAALDDVRAVGSQDVVPSQLVAFCTGPSTGTTMCAGTVRNVVASCSETWPAGQSQVFVFTLTDTFIQVSCDKDDDMIFHVALPRNMPRKGLVGFINIRFAPVHIGQVILPDGVTTAPDQPPAPDEETKLTELPAGFFMDNRGRLFHDANECVILPAAASPIVTVSNQALIFKGPRFVFLPHLHFFSGAVCEVEVQVRILAAGAPLQIGITNKSNLQSSTLDMVVAQFDPHGMLSVTSFLSSTRLFESPVAIQIEGQTSLRVSVASSGASHTLVLRRSSDDTLASVQLPWQGPLTGVLCVGSDGALDGAIERIVRVSGVPQDMPPSTPSTAWANPVDDILRCMSADLDAAAMRWNESIPAVGVALSDGGRTASTVTQCRGWVTQVGSHWITAGCWEIALQIKQTPSTHFFVGLVGPPVIKNPGVYLRQPAAVSMSGAGDLFAGTMPTRSGLPLPLKAGSAVTLKLDMGRRFVRFHLNGVFIPPAMDLPPQVTIAACFGDCRQAISVSSIKQATFA